MNNYLIPLIIIYVHKLVPINDGSGCISRIRSRLTNCKSGSSAKCVSVDLLTAENPTCLITSFGYLFLVALSSSFNFIADTPAYMT